MEVLAESIVSLKFPDNESAKAAKRKLRRHGIHAYLSADRTFDRYPGKEAWNNAHTVVNVVDHFPEVGDLADTYTMLARVLGN